MGTWWQRLLIEAMVSVMLIVLSVVGLLFLFSWPVFRALYFNCPFFVKKTAFLKGKKKPHSSLSAYIYVSFVNLFTLSCFLFLMTDTVS